MSPVVCAHDCFLILDIIVVYEVRYLVACSLYFSKKKCCFCESHDQEVIQAFKEMKILLVGDIYLYTVL